VVVSLLVELRHVLASRRKPNKSKESTEVHETDRIRMTKVCGEVVMSF